MAEERTFAEHYSKEELERKELEKRLAWYSKKYGSYIEKRGLKNWKNLFNKPTLYEWTILFMILMALFIAWAYERDTALCRQVIEKQESFFKNFSENTNKNITFADDRNTNIPDINFTLILNEEIYDNQT